jgi:hypothetical protein
MNATNRGLGSSLSAAHRHSPAGPYPLRAKVLAGFIVTISVLGASACGHKDAKAYDIAPIFPLSSDKCAKYNGTAEGSGFGAHCWVTKVECENAASDWRQAMRQSGQTDAIEFRC